MATEAARQAGPAPRQSHRVAVSVEGVTVETQPPEGGTLFLNFLTRTQ